MKRLEALEARAKKRRTGLVTVTLSSGEMKVMPSKRPLRAAHN